MPELTDPSLDPIFAYLREHSGRYSDSALREQLLENGYTPAEVDRALAIYQQENPPTFTARESVWPKAVLVAAANVLLLLIAIVSWANKDVLIGIGCELPAGLLLALWPPGRVWGRALVFGFLLSVAAALLLGGVCALFLFFAMRHTS
jgi:hypothetical protein